MAKHAQLASAVHAAADVTSGEGYPAHLCRAALLQEAGGADGLSSAFAEWVTLRAPAPSPEEAVLARFLSHATADALLAPALRGGLPLWLARVRQLCGGARDAAAAYAVYCLLLSSSNVLRLGCDFGDLDVEVALECLLAPLADGGVPDGVRCLAVDTARELLTRHAGWGRTAVGGGESVAAAVAARRAALVRALSSVGASRLVACYASVVEALAAQPGPDAGTASTAAVVEACLGAWLAEVPPGTLLPGWGAALLSTVAGRLASASIVGEEAREGQGGHVEASLRLFGACCTAFGPALVALLPAGASPKLFAPVEAGRLFAAALRLAGLQLKLSCDEAEELVRLCGQPEATPLPPAAPAAAVTPGVTYAESMRAEIVADERAEVEEGGAAEGRRPPSRPAAVEPLDRVRARSSALGAVADAAASAFVEATAVVGAAAGAEGGASSAVTPATWLSMRDTLSHTSAAALAFAADLWHSSDMRFALQQQSGGAPSLELAPWVEPATALCRRVAAAALRGVAAYLGDECDTLEAELIAALPFARRICAAEAGVGATAEAQPSVTAALVAALAPRAGGDACCAALLSSGWLSTTAAYLLHLCRRLSLAAAEAEARDRGRRVVDELPALSTLHLPMLKTALCTAQLVLHLLQAPPAVTETDGEDASLLDEARLDIASGCVLAANRLGARPSRTTLAVAGADCPAVAAYLSQLLLAVAAAARPSPLPPGTAGRWCSVGSALQGAAFDVFRDVLPGSGGATAAAGEEEAALEAVRAASGLPWLPLPALTLFDTVLDATGGLEEAGGSKDEEGRGTTRRERY